MFKKHGSIPIKNSTSMLPNNLAIMTDSESQITTFAVIHKFLVNLTTASSLDWSDIMNQKQIIPKLNKDGTQISTVSSSATQVLGSHEKANNNLGMEVVPTLTQCKFLEIFSPNSSISQNMNSKNTKRTIFVICSNKGIFVYEDDCVNLIYFQNYRNMKSSQADETLYARGLTVIYPNLLAIGTSCGSILIYEIPFRGTNIRLINELLEKDLRYGVGDLAANVSGTNLACSDTNGNIFVWDINVYPSIKLAYKLSDPSPCTCLNIWKGFLVAGFGSGKISLSDVASGMKLVDIAAHARWVNSIDIKENRLVSGGEDCFFRVWELNEVNGKLKVSHEHSERVQDSHICSVNFVKNASQICVSCFDTSELLIYKESH